MAAPGWKTFRVIALEYDLPPGAAQVNWAVDPALFDIGAGDAPEDWHPYNQVREVHGPWVDQDGHFTVAFTFDNYRGAISTGVFHCYTVCERHSERRENKQIKRARVGSVELVKPARNPSFVVRDVMISDLRVTRHPGQRV
jgi:hypothetical protein